MSQKKLSLALGWKLAAEELTKAKAREAEARKDLVCACFPTLQDGLNKLDLPAGHVLKVTNYPNHNLDARKTPAAIAAFRALGEVGQMLADRLFKAKFELSVGEYKKLSAKHQALLSDALTISPATPKVELTEPA